MTVSKAGSGSAWVAAIVGAILGVVPGAIALAQQPAPSPTGQPETTAPLPAPAPVPSAPASGPVAPAPAVGGLTEADLQNLEGLADRYRETNAGFEKDIESLLRREIDRRRQGIDATYQRESGKLDDQLRVRRNEAIAAFERFTQRYPTNREYTPEVMFRLAELYYDQAQDDYHIAAPEYETQHRLWERGKVAEEPKEPLKDYGKAIRMYGDLLDRFPEFANADAAYYAMGYCLQDMNERDRALQAFRDLIEKHPKSRWVPEAWLLIGEYFFDVGKYRDSIEAYNNALTDKDSRYYDMALYKLAWSYFQMYDYPTAIRTFKQLIERVDERKTKGQAGLGQLLRSESIEYLGVSLADDDWNGDGEKDKDATVARAVSFMSEHKPYEREILEKYADTLYSQHEMAKYPMAIEAYRAVIAQEPTSRGNAIVKEKIIGVYDEMHDTERMTAERQDMVRQFGPGSAWYEANRTHPEVLARVDRQVELALSQAAQFHNKRAQELKAQAATTGIKDYSVAALQEYKAAAEAYEEYLHRFPDTKFAYDNAYYLAECYYYSFDFQRATLAYRKVRDWPGKTTYLEAAAYNVIVSIEKEAAKRVQEGSLTTDDLPGDANSIAEVNPPAVEGKVQIDALAIPPLTKEWIDAVEFYLQKNLARSSDPEVGPRFSFRIAAELYKRRHLEDARRRFEEILVKFPQSVVASNSAVGIINSYRMENDWENLAIWSRKIDEMKVGKPEERAALAQEVKVFQLGAQFKEAEKLFDAGEYQKAAEAFVAVVEQDPKNRVADKGLQNAAVAYQKLKHYDSAARVYEKIVTDYPASPYVEGALFQLAENARKFLDFDRAVRTFQALLTRFPRSEQVPYAMYQIALLQEAAGKLHEAAQAYVRFVDKYPADAESGPVLFKAGRIEEKLNNRDEAMGLYRRFVRQYGGAAAMNERVVEALARSADIYRSQGQMRDWESLARTVIREYESRGLQAGTPVAAWPARFLFQITEELFKQYEALQFAGDLRTQGRLIQQKKRMLGDLEAQYAQVVPYKAVEWTSAAVFRSAQLYELFAKALFTAQIPKMTEEEEDLYRTQIEDAAKGYQDAAQERYVKIIEENRRLKTANEWTRKAVEAMNKYRPAEYPLVKEERRAQDFEVRFQPAYEDSL